LNSPRNKTDRHDHCTALVRAARKDFEKIKARYIDYSKQLQVERQGVQQGMQQMGMMGGMGGMGGGMR
jgi:hypothetical protein